MRERGQGRNESRIKEYSTVEVEKKKKKETERNRTTREQETR